MSGTIHVGGSPLYLGTGDVADKLRAADGLDVESSDASGSSAGHGAVLRYFTIPNHLYERLWLKEIPLLTGAAEPADDQAETVRWETFDTLTMALQLVDEGFRKPVEAIFHAMPQAPAKKGEDIAVAAGGEDGKDGQARWTRCAWLNLDERAQALRVVLKEAAEAKENNAGFAEFTIEPGEGVVWRRDQLIVNDRPGDEPGTVQTKLLLLAG